MRVQLFFRSFIYSTALFISSHVFSQASPEMPAMAGVCLSPVEQSLAQKINDYRRQKHLPPVPVSKSLTYVAQLHVRDLVKNYRQSNRCNLHSWSDKGPWTSCCYTADQRKASCMWNKPRELTDYKGDGFEIAYYSTYPYSSPGDSARAILKGWQGSKGHNQVIINAGMWKAVEWKAMGIGIDGEYAVVWFGELPDDAGIPGGCTE